MSIWIVTIEEQDGREILYPAISIYNNEKDFRNALFDYLNEKNEYGVDMVAVEDIIANGGVHMGGDYMDQIRIVKTEMNPKKLNQSQNDWGFVAPIYELYADETESRIEDQLEEAERVLQEEEDIISNLDEAISYGDPILLRRALEQEPAVSAEQLDAIFTDTPDEYLRQILSLAVKNYTGTVKEFTKVFINDPNNKYNYEKAEKYRAILPLDWDVYSKSVKKSVKKAPRNKYNSEVSEEYHSNLPLPLDWKDYTNVKKQ